MEKYLIFWREKQSAISETYGIIRTCALRIDLKFEMGLSPRMHQTSKIGIIRTVKGAYKSNRLLADLRRQNGMVKHGSLSICILLILPSVIINNKDLLKTRFSTFFHRFLVKTSEIISYYSTLLRLLININCISIPLMHARPH